MKDALDRIYERVLVVRCQAGDGAAFTELVERYHHRLRAFLRRMLGDAHAAEDAVQDAWLDAFRGVGRLHDPAAFEAWLFRVARDRAYRILRRKGLLIDPIAGAAQIPTNGDDSADHDLLMADEQQVVRAAVDRLPLEQREVLLLRFVEEMSYEQIAMATGCEVGTVRSRLHYAKRSLRKLIEGNHGHE
jgi:RNA polymerase sigma-70 factor (ECF subfamily)